MELRKETEGGGDVEGGWQKASGQEKIDGGWGKRRKGDSGGGMREGTMVRE